MTDAAQVFMFESADGPLAYRDVGTGPRWCCCTAASPTTACGTTWCRSSRPTTG